MAPMAQTPCYFQALHFLTIVEMDNVVTTITKRIQEFFIKAREIMRSVVFMMHYGSLCPTTIAVWVTSKIGCFNLLPECSTIVGLRRHAKTPAVSLAEEKCGNRSAVRVSSRRSSHQNIIALLSCSDTSVFSHNAEIPMKNDDPSEIPW